MRLEQILAWLPIVTWVALMTAAKVRALAMHRRGLRVIVVDWQRPLTDVLYDALLIAVFLCWFYLLVAEAWPLSLAWMSEWLAGKVLDALPVRLVGAAMLVAAPILFAIALRSFEGSWRIGIDRKRPGALVTGGIFGWTRNPIYTAFDLIIVGAFLIHGRVIFLLQGAVLVLLVHGVVLREERFLEEQYGNAFREYRGRVRRYGLL